MSRRWAHEALVQLALDTKKTYDLDAYDGVKRLIRAEHYLRTVWFVDFKLAREFVRAYTRRKVHEPFYVLLARAIIHTPRLRVDEGMEPLLGTDQFLEEFRRQLLVVMSNERPIPNVDYFCDLLVSEWRSVNEEFSWRQYARQTRPFTDLCSMLANDLPPIDKVRTLLGNDVAEDYKNVLELCESQEVQAVLDVTDPLEAGAQKKWSRRQILKRVEQMQLFRQCVGKNEHEASELVETHNERARKRSSSLNETRRQEILAFNAWRVRPYETSKWIERIPDQLWEQYTKLERELKDHVSVGCVQWLPRRHFSEPGVVAFEANILALTAVVEYFKQKDEIDLRADARVPVPGGGAVEYASYRAANRVESVSVGAETHTERV